MISTLLLKLFYRITEESFLLHLLRCSFAIGRYHPAAFPYPQSPSLVRGAKPLPMDLNFLREYGYLFSLLTSLTSSCSTGRVADVKPRVCSERHWHRNMRDRDHDDASNERVLQVDTRHYSIHSGLQREGAMECREPKSLHCAWTRPVLF
jgi:hypothetical protein